MQNAQERPQPIEIEESGEELLEYELSIPWASLSIKPKPGLETPITIMMNRCSGINFQCIIWGKDERDQWTDQHKILRLA